METTSADGAPLAPRTGMFRELLAIHTLLRRDLRTVRQLATDARAGRATPEIVDDVRALATSSPLFRLRYGCLYYCRFVHSHHTIEDAAVFPMVRRRDPALNRVIDRLEEDHLTVHHISERIASAAERLLGDPTDATRRELVTALDDLETHLLAHLTLEEAALGPLLSTWDRWPLESTTPA